MVTSSKRLSADREVHGRENSCDAALCAAYTPFLKHCLNLVRSRGCEITLEKEATWIEKEGVAAGYSANKTADLVGYLAHRQTGVSRLLCQSRQ